jgi:hypothetical protein
MQLSSCRRGRAAADLHPALARIVDRVDFLRRDVPRHSARRGFGRRRCQRFRVDDPVFGDEARQIRVLYQEERLAAGLAGRMFISER